MTLIACLIFYLNIYKNYDIIGFKKYSFDFDKYVADAKAMHKHYKLPGAFTGEPKFKMHDEFQATAEESKKGKK